MTLNDNLTTNQIIKSVNGNKLNPISELIENFFFSFLKKEKEDKKYNKNILEKLIILILAYLLRDANSLEFQFNNLINDKEIQNYELTIISLSYNKSIQNIKLSNFLWHISENFSLFTCMKDLFLYNKTLKCINYQGNLFNRNDLKAITIALKKNKSLSFEELEVNSSGYLNDMSIKKDYDDFRENLYIKRLNFSINIYSDFNNERVHFCNKCDIEYGKIKNFSIYRNIIDETIIKIFYDCLSKNTHITKLKIRFENIKREWVPEIVNLLIKNQQIFDLDLSHNNLCNDSIIILCKYLKINKNLKHLNLESNNFSDRGLMILLDTLSDNENISELDISWNNYTDTSALFLKQFLLNSKSIEKIFISKQNLTEEGINIIKQAFFENTNIKKLAIGMSDVSR